MLLYAANDGVLDARIALQRGDDAFEVVVLEVLAEDGEVEAVDTLLRVRAVAGFDLDNAAGKEEDQPRLILDLAPERPENLLVEDLDERGGELFAQRFRINAVVEADPRLQVFEHPPLQHVHQQMPNWAGTAHLFRRRVLQAG